MSNYENMNHFKLYLFIFSLKLYHTLAQISDKRLCVDLECKSPVSYAITLTRYLSPDPNYLSFTKNQNIIIFSKSAGSKTDLWGAEIDGKRGYVPKNLIRETKIIKKPTILVDTEGVNGSHTTTVPSKSENVIVQPDKVQAPFEVVDGTMVYLNEANHGGIKQSESKEQSETLVTEDSNEHISTYNGSVDTLYKPVDEVEVKNNIGEAENIPQNKQIDIQSINKSQGVISDYNINLDNKEFPELQTSSSEKKKELGSEQSIHNHKYETDETAQKLTTVSSQIDPLEPKENNVVENEKTVPIESKPEKQIEDTPKDETLSDMGNVVEGLAASVSPKLNGVSDNVDNEYLTGMNIEKNDVSEEADTSETDWEASLESGEQFSSEQKSEENSIEPGEQLSREQKTEEILFSHEVLSDEMSFNGSENPTSQSLNIGNLPGDPVINPDHLDHGIHVSITEIPDVQKLKLENTVNSIENQAEDSTPEPAFFPYVQSYSETPKLELPEQEPPSSTPESVHSLKDESQESNVHSLVQSSQEISLDTALPVTLGDNEIQEPVVYSSIETSTEVPLDSVLHVTSVNNEVQEPAIYLSVETSTAVPLDTVTSVHDEIQEPVIYPSIETSTVVPLVSVLPITSMFNRNNDENVEDVSSYERTALDDEIEDLQTELADQSDYENSVVDAEGPSGSLNDVEIQEIEESSIPAEEFSDSKNIHNEDIREDKDSGITGKFLSLFSGIFNTFEEKASDAVEETILPHIHPTENEFSQSINPIIHFTDGYCDVGESSESCHDGNKYVEKNNVLTSKDSLLPFNSLNSDFIMLLLVTAVSIIVLLFGYLLFDKCKREGSLIAKINHLEKELLISSKERDMLSEEKGISTGNSDFAQETIDNLKQELEEVHESKSTLEEQVQSLEKELENSTEVGLELNRMLADILTSENGSETIMSNVEKLQRQLAEQQGIVTSMREMLQLKETEAHELNLELDITNKKVFELQTELDKLLLNVIKIEEEKSIQQSTLEADILTYKEKYEKVSKDLQDIQHEFEETARSLKLDLLEAKRNVELKTKEFEVLKSSVKEIANIKNAGTLDSLLEVTAIKAELELLKIEYQAHTNNLHQEQEAKIMYEKRAHVIEEELKRMTIKYEDVDKSKVELQTKLQVLNGYFKEREAQLQKELSKYESMWTTKQGEATSSSERIKYMQGELQNYKSQNESLKQEIVSQEVELKSQISVLEKKVHENWVSARQAERRLEDLKQEAGQLRNRLTLRERALQEDKSHRIQSPLEQNGDSMSGLHDSPSSPPLIYNSRDHITKSPTMPPGLAFLPPPGAPFMPLPHLPFMPPPPSLFPGDHRPPPLGRMSSPPLNSRYSPELNSYSPYDRRSPSPPYDESDYGASPPPPHRGYSPFGRIDFSRLPPPPPIGKPSSRKPKGPLLSSGSGNSNDSLDNNQHSKV